jgi:hypothetical protein
MAAEGNDDDYCLFVNRSGYGPYRDGWYSRYVDSLETSGSSLVGTTINFLGHPLGKQREVSTHVQTYAYLASLATLRPLIGQFPAENEVDRVALIDAGEIGLSAFVLENGGSLSCLAWPGHKFDLHNPTSADLPLADIKKIVKDFPFLYKRGLRSEVIGRMKFRYWRFQNGFL